MQQQVPQEFEEQVKKYVLIDNKIKSAQEAIRALKKEKDKASENILIYVKTHELEDEPIGITGGQLKYFVSKSVVPMNREYIQHRLEQYFKSKSKAKEIVEFLYSDRESKQKETIKRVKSRK